MMAYESVKHPEHCPIPEYKQVVVEIVKLIFNAHYKVRVVHYANDPSLKPIATSHQKNRPIENASPANANRKQRYPMYVKVGFCLLACFTSKIS